MQTHNLKIGTRASKLAMAQAYEVRDRIIATHGLDESRIEIVPMSTEGDRILDRALADIGGKGLFTEEIENALREGRIDIAVHSTKDIPTVLPENLHLSVYLKREDPRDAFISKSVKRLSDLPIGATVGSSSLRRQALIRRLRPDLNVVVFRGNVQTRLAKLEEGVAEGTFLAVAGLKRLGLQNIISEIMNPDEFIPAPGQGAISIESRVGDETIDRLIAPLKDVDTHIALACERRYLADLDGSCRTPLGGLALIDGEKLHFRGMIASPDGGQFFAIAMEGGINDAAEIGAEAAKKLRRDAGEGFFASW